MIQAINNQTVVYVEVEGACFGFLRNPNGSICLLNGKSAVEFIASLGNKVANALLEAAETADGMDKALSMAKGLYPEYVNDPVAKGLIGKMEAAIKKVDNSAEKLRVLLTDLTVLRNDANKFESPRQKASPNEDLVRDLLAGLKAKLDASAPKSPEVPKFTKPEGEYSGCGDCPGCDDLKTSVSGEVSDDNLPPELLELKKRLEARGGEVRIIAANVGDLPDEFKNLLGNLDKPSSILH